MVVTRPSRVTTHGIIHGYQPQRFLSHHHCADCLLPPVMRVWEHKIHTYTLLVASQLCDSAGFIEAWLKPLQKKKMELLFPFIYMTDFSKAVTSSDAWAFHVLWAVSDSTHEAHKCRQRIEQPISSLKSVWKKDFAYACWLSLSVHHLVLRIYFLVPTRWFILKLHKMLGCK